MDQFDFKLRRKTFKIDWKQLAGVDVESVARCGDFDALQTHLRHVVYCDAGAEFANCSDTSLLKVFQLCQLIAEYLLQCQHVLSAGISDLRQQLHLSKQCSKKTKLKLERSERELARWCKYRKSCKNGKQCDNCGKVFVSQTYLNSHMVRRHGDKQTAVQHRQQQTPRTTAVDAATMTSPIDLARATVGRAVISPDQYDSSGLSSADPPYLHQRRPLTSDQLQIQLLRQRLNQVEELLVISQAAGVGTGSGACSRDMAVQVETHHPRVAESTSPFSDSRRQSAELLEMKLTEQQREINQLQQKLSRLAGDENNDTRCVSPGLVAPPSEPPTSGSSTTVFSTVSTSASVLEAAGLPSDVSEDDTGSDCDNYDAADTNKATVTRSDTAQRQLQSSPLDVMPVPSARTCRPTGSNHDNHATPTGSNYNNRKQLSDDPDVIDVDCDDVTRRNHHHRRRGRRRRRYDWGILCSPTTSPRVHHAGDADRLESPPHPPLVSVPSVPTCAPLHSRSVPCAAAEYSVIVGGAPLSVPSRGPAATPSRLVEPLPRPRSRHKSAGRLVSLARALQRHVTGRARHCRSEERLSSLVAPPTGSVESLPAAASERLGVSFSSDLMSDQYMTADSQPQTPQTRYTRLSRAKGGYTARKQKRPAPPLPPSLTL